MTKSFDEWYKEAKKLNNDGFSAKDFFEAGQQSKQAEIDELQNKYDAMYRAFTVADDCRKEWHRCYVGVCQREDELQKRIDEAVNMLAHGEGYGYEQCTRLAINILKGNSHES